MFDFLVSALKAIPTAATSSYALIAYVCAIVAYVVVAWRVSRNKTLLEHLKSLPPADRFPALQVEMGGVHLASGISPEQWLRSRITRYYFLAYVIAALLIALVLSLALFYYRSDDAPPPTSAFRITVLDEGAGTQLLPHVFTFPLSDIAKRRTAASFRDLLLQLPGPTRDLSNFTIFRTSDEDIITLDHGDAITARNMGVLVLPNRLIEQMKDRHFAFTWAMSQLPKE
jgi:hypothetical protein